MLPCIRLAPSGESYGVTVGLSESNGSLPLGGWLKGTCTLGSALGQMLGNEYGRTLRLPNALVSSVYYLHDAFTVSYFIF